VRKLEPEQWIARSRRAILAAGLILAVVSVKPARAVLGDGAESVEADQSVLGGERSQVTHSGFTVEAITTAAGITVNEYVSSAGTVFAVSWRGSRHPDLSMLLGPYFSEYQAAANQPTAHRRGLRIRTGNVVVETGGHPGDLWGRAYLPALLPLGVDAEGIQ
jgi:Protein of unknown function (DUF2844)